MKLFALILGLAMFQMSTGFDGWRVVVVYFFGLAIGWTFCHDYQKDKR